MVGATSVGMLLSFVGENDVDVRVNNICNMDSTDAENRFLVVESDDHWAPDHHNSKRNTILSPPSCCHYQ